MSNKYFRSRTANKKLPFVCTHSGSRDHCNVCHGHISISKCRNLDAAYCIQACEFAVRRSAFGECK